MSDDLSWVYISQGCVGKETTRFLYRYFGRGVDPRALMHLYKTLDTAVLQLRVGPLAQICLQQG